MSPKTVLFQKDHQAVVEVVGGIESPNQTLVPGYQVLWGQNRESVAVENT